jgi:hypothetical protein
VGGAVDGLGDGLAELLGDLLGETLVEGEIELLGEIEAEGLFDGDTLELAEGDSLEDVEALGEKLALREILGLELKSPKSKLSVPKIMVGLYTAYSSSIV